MYILDALHNSAHDDALLKIKNLAWYWPKCERHKKTRYTKEYKNMNRFRVWYEHFYDWVEVKLTSILGLIQSGSVFEISSKSCGSWWREFVRLEVVSLLERFRRGARRSGGPMKGGYSRVTSSLRVWSRMTSESPELSSPEKSSSMASVGLFVEDGVVGVTSLLWRNLPQVLCDTFLWWDV